MSCPYTTPSPNPVPTQRYRALHPDGRRLIQQWLARATAVICSDQGSPFEAFIFLWIAFNGFASCVTGEEQDSKIIKRLGNCPRMREEFSNLLGSDTEFSYAVELFRGSWPVFKVHKLRQLNPRGPTYSNRAEQVRDYMSRGCDEYRPECHSYHLGRGHQTPADWPHTLNAVYQVRCNLFHGEKSLTAENDREIVTRALLVLKLFIDKTGILQ
jgi:hypothetical protein